MRLIVAALTVIVRFTVQTVLNAQERTGEVKGPLRVNDVVFSHQLLLKTTDEQNAERTLCVILITSDV